MTNTGNADGAAELRGVKNLRLITEVALTTMSSRGLSLAFQEQFEKPTPGLFYMLAHCTFPLLEEIMKAIIEVGTDPTDALPQGLYSRQSHDLLWLHRQMRAPTVFTPDAYRGFMAEVNRHLRHDTRPNHLSLSRMQAEHPLFAGYSVFDNIIQGSARIWQKSKYLEINAVSDADRDLLPLASDAARWLLYEFLRFEPAHRRVTDSFPELERMISELLHVYD